MTAQTNSILNRLARYLESGKVVTGKVGWERFQTLNIRNRICDLEEIGYQIEHKPVLKNGKRYMSYKLISAP